MGTKLVSFLLITFLLVAFFAQDSGAVSPLTLTVSHSQTAGGTITSSPGGISCDSDCTEVYSAGQIVALTATESAGRSFAAWSPGQFCAEPSNLTTTCTVTVPAEGLDMTAVWEYDSYSYSVSKSGTGNGTVTGAGINCGSTCSSSVSNGDWTTITATPATGSVFSGWQIGGTICDSLGSTTDIVVTTPTCNIYGGGPTNPGYTAIARFDLIGQEGSDSPASDSEEDSDDPTSNEDKKDAKKTLAAPQAYIRDSEGNAIFSAGNVPAVFRQGETVRIGGITEPNATIKLYIFSDPIEAETSADENGVWEYNITGLGVGNHRVEAEVVSQDGKEKSARETMLSFFVTDASTNASTNLASSGSFPTSYQGTSYTLLALIGLIVIAAAVIGIRFKKRKLKRPKW